MCNQTDVLVSFYSTVYIFWLIKLLCPSFDQQEMYKEKFIGENPSFLRTDGSALITEVKPQVTPKNVANKEDSQVSKTGPNRMIIRGMTFYKSEPDLMVADDGEPGENRKCKL